jgi:hypothetical protein
MSKRTRALVVGATLAAMTLAGMTAVAQAHVTEYTIKPYASAPLEPRAGESHRQVASQQQTATSDAVELFRRGERASQEQNPTDAVELFRRGERASQDQPTIADTRRPPTEAQVGEPWRHPGNVPVRPPEPSGQPDWLVPAIGVLAAVLTLVAGLVVMAARRAGRRVRAGQAA